MVRAWASQELARERVLARVLSIDRYFSFIVAVGLMVAWPSFRGQVPPLTHLIAVGVVGVYVALSVLVPLHPWPGRLAAYALLALDFGLGLGTLLATGGLESGLLLYSLTPVLAASLFLEQRLALVTASLSSLSLLTVHLTGSSHFTWLLANNTLAIFLLYAIAASLVAVVPYNANVKVRRRLESEATAEERRRLRRDVHDSLAQQLGFLTMKARQLRDLATAELSPRLTAEVSEMQDALQRTYTDTRVYLDVLSLPSDVSLASALEELARDFSARSGVHLETSLARDGLRFSAAQELQFLAIAQEALANVQKHAQASQVRLSLTNSAGVVELLIEDNGKGFDQQLAGPAGHYGLVGMRERAQEIGATLAITSAPGQGTGVRLTLPRQP